MRVLAGTSGFSYKEWKGSFYPEKIKPEDMLAYYAQHLPCVELNNTFYRMPKREVVAGWAAQVPESFRFAIKVSQRITHRKRLKDVGEELDYLLGQLEPLGALLGTLLVQLPPNLKRDDERLERFLDALAGRARAAFEFRHESWLTDGVFEALRARGAALVASESEGSEATLYETAPFGYLRLRRPHYRTRDLQAWLKRVRRQPWEETYVFFKHEQEAGGPPLAAQMLALAELGSKRVRPPRRGQEEAG